MSRNSIDQAHIQFECIQELMEALKEATENEVVSYEGDDLDYDDILQRIEETPLTVEIRTQWYCPGDPAPDFEYNILLCTGGPAVRIIGDLNKYMEPETASLEHQDWFEHWTKTPLPSDGEDILISFASTFMFCV